MSFVAASKGGILGRSASRLACVVALGCAWLASACTLTSDPLDPDLVDGPAVLPAGPDPAQSMELNDASDCEQGDCCGPAASCAEPTPPESSSEDLPDEDTPLVEAASPVEPEPEAPVDEPIEQVDPDQQPQQSPPPSCGARGAECGRNCSEVCPDGEACERSLDCSSNLCRFGTCQIPACNDTVQNQDETDVDCGGACPNACDDGLSCSVDEDCDSLVCEAQGCIDGVAQCCQAPTCDDGLANGGEPVPDCGNDRCGPCAVGSACLADAHCESGACQGGQCVPPVARCDDGVQNGDEPNVDCGGSDPACPRCGDRQACFQASDCANNNCGGGVCISCGSGVLDGDESDIDCGGSDPFCRRCSPGERCRSNTDCLSNFCFAGFC
jgi:hypothetical protein